MTNRIAINTTATTATPSNRRSPLQGRFRTHTDACGRETLLIPVSCLLIPPSQNETANRANRRKLVQITAKTWARFTPHASRFTLAVHLPRLCTPLHVKKNSAAVARPVAGTWGNPFQSNLEPENPKQSHIHFSPFSRIRAFSDSESRITHHASRFFGLILAANALR